VYDVPNEPFFDAAEALAGGTQFPLLVLVDAEPADLVRIEGHQRLTVCAVLLELAHGRVFRELTPAERNRMLLR
jgi:hypothetical protein